MFLLFFCFTLNMANDSPASSIETIALSNPRTLLNVNMVNVTKLTATNFIMWNRQVHSLLERYNLAGYVDGCIDIMSPTLTVDDQVIVNNEYVLWKRQDKLIYSALLGAISISAGAPLHNHHCSGNMEHTLCHLRQAQSWPHPPPTTTTQTVDKRNQFH